MRLKEGKLRPLDILFIIVCATVVVAAVVPLFQYVTGQLDARDSVKITTKPDIVGESTLYDYEYVVDKTTGVVYLQVSAHERVGITPYLKPDGTPYLASELGLDLGGN